MARPPKPPNIPRIRKALIVAEGNVSAAATKLRMPVSALRHLVGERTELQEALLEVEEQALDEAEAVVRAALREGDGMRRLQAAGHILRTNAAARRRGFGNV